MKRILFILLLFSVSFGSCAQRNYTAKKLLFGQVQKPYVNYGYLYNWYAAVDSRNIAPIGWHIPTNSEFITLSNYLGGDAISGGKLKELGIIYWQTPNTGATNEVKFNARANGWRSYGDAGSFKEIGQFARLLTTTQVATLTNYAFKLNYNNDDSQTSYLVFKGDGGGIRLVKDATSLTHGQTSTMIGNDGKIYRTICIGTQEWTADNIAETKYRNGDDIPVVTDNSAWVLDILGARCVYNNLESYR